MAAATFVFDVLALVGGTVHSMVPGSTPAVATVLVADDRIRAVGTDVEIPADAKVVDVSGMHVIPGLIDGFAYHDPEHDLLYLRAGVALVRDHGNELGRIFASRDRPERDARCGPLLSVAGAVIDGVPPATNAAVICRTAPEARDAVLHLFEEKVDFLAYHASLSVECRKAVCEAAKEKELVVWGPRASQQTLGEALAMGQRGFVFLDALVPDGKTWESAAIGDFEPNAKLLVEQRGAVVPMLRGYVRMLEDPGQGEAELALLGPQYESMWRAELDERRAWFAKANRAAMGSVLGKQRSVLRTLHELGVALVPGSGAPHPWLVPGEGLVRELSEWQSVGIPAARCLEYATRGAAKALGLSESRGSLEPGKFADLVVLRGDPAADVAALANVEAVVLRGKLFDSAELSQRTSELRKSLDEQRKLASAPIDVDPPSLPEGKVLLSGRVETVGSTGRMAGERFAIVREVDDTLTFCGSRKILPTAGNSGSQIDVRQRVNANRLSSFEVKVRNTGHEFVVRGSQVAGQWRVERRFDGAFVDIQAARESLEAIDCDSVTTFLLLGHVRGTGAFPVVRFDEGLQMEVVRWDLAFDDDGDHAFRTPGGLKLAGFEDYGAIKAVVEQVGAGAVQTTLMDVDRHGGEGLMLPAAKLELARKAREKPAKDGK